MQIMLNRKDVCEGLCHSVEIAEIYCPHLCQKFREINAFSRNIFQVRVNFSLFYTVSVSVRLWVRRFCSKAFSKKQVYLNNFSIFKTFSSFLKPLPVLKHLQMKKLKINNSNDTLDVNDIM